MSRLRVVLLGVCFPVILGAADPVALTIDVGSESYPAGALAQKLEGEVAVTLNISAAGEVRCTAKGDSALAQLKRPSCELVVTRNVFTPGLKDGVVIDSEYRLDVRWSLKTRNEQFGGAIPVARSLWVSYADYPAIAGHQMLTGKVDVAFDISEYGRAENCKVTRTNATNSLAGAICPLVRKSALFLPALTPQGQPRRTRGELKTEWLWPDQCPARGCGSPDKGL